MEVVRALDPGLTTRPSALTMGKFDGVHLGHRRLIETAVERARALGLGSAVLTWEPHPNAVIRPHQPLQLLTSLEEKIEQIARLGPDLLVIAPFTTATMATSAEDYMAQLVAAIPLRELWVGEGFAMGKGRAGETADDDSDDGGTGGSEERVAHRVAHIAIAEDLAEPLGGLTAVDDGADETDQAGPSVQQSEPPAADQPDEARKY